MIHAPEEASGPKDAAGRPVLKPIEFQDTKVTRKGLVIGIGSVAVALIGAIVARFTGGLPMFGVVAVAILLAPPLAWAAYTVLREQELEPFIGQELLVRVLISSVTLVALWFLYWWLPPYLLDADSISKMSWVVSGIALTLLLLAGGFASMLVFEFDYVWASYTAACI